MSGVDFAEYLSTALKVVFHFVFSPLGLVIIFGPLVLQNFVTRLKATIDKANKSTVILSGTNLEEERFGHALIEISVHYYSLVAAMWVWIARLTNMLFDRMGLVTIDRIVLQDKNIPFMVIVLLLLAAVILFLFLILKAPFSNFRAFSQYIAPARSQSWFRRILSNHLTWARFALAGAGLGLVWFETVYVTPVVRAR